MMKFRSTHLLLRFRALDDRSGEFVCVEKDFVVEEYVIESDDRFFFLRIRSLMKGDLR
jgi:hypothetical protein